MNVCKVFGSKEPSVGRCSGAVHEELGMGFNLFHGMHFFRVLLRMLGLCVFVHDEVCAVEVLKLQAGLNSAIIAAKDGGGTLVV